MTRSFAVWMFFALTACGFTKALDPLLTSDNLWSQKQDDFMKTAEEYGFEWTSNTRDSARAAQKEMNAFGPQPSGALPSGI